KGAKTIDYDRLIVGGTGSLYVSFDNHQVGVLQGKGVVAGLKAKGKYGSHPVVAELNGGPTDNNAFLFKGGYDSILKPLYPKGTNAAAKAAVQLLKGQKLTTTGTFPNGKRKMPAFLIAPISITKSNYTILFKEHFLKKSEVCVGDFAKFCK